MKTRFSNRLSISLLVAALSLSGLELSAQIRVTPVRDESSFAGKKGVVYALPRTRILVDLRVKKTQHIPGPLAAYAKDYLGVGEVITKKQVDYSLTDVRIDWKTEQDPGRIYLIEKEEKSSGEIYLSLDPDQPVISMEKFSKDAPTPGLPAWEPGLFLTKETEGLFRKYSEAATREVVDTIIRRISIDTLVIEETTFKRSMVGFTDVEKAQEALDRIRQIEQDKYNLLVGYQETAYSGDALGFMYGKLEEERQAYVRLFTGVILTEELGFRFEAVPDAGQEDQRYVLTGFSEEAGIIPAEEDAEVALELEFSPLPSGFKEADVLFTGLVYRVPAETRASVLLGERELASAWIPVLQLGPVYALPAEFKRIDFDLKTGTVRKIVLE